MQHAHYALQALLYTVALHRYLRWRLPDYDPERNLAGVLYLFLRGMTGRRHAGGRRHPVRRLRVAAADGARRGAERRARPRGRDVSAQPIEADPFDVRRASNATGLLRDFNDAGVLDAADVHVALRLADLGGEDDESVALAAALAVRGPRLGHVYVDLATIRETATVDADEAVDLSALAWPPVAAWTERLEASDLVAGGRGRWPTRAARCASRVAPGSTSTATGARSARSPPTCRRSARRPPTTWTSTCSRRGSHDCSPTRTTSASARPARRPFSTASPVVAGGPGTGKTTTVARIVALLAEQAAAAGAPSRSCRARRADRQGGRAPGGGGPRGGGRA